MPSVLQHGYRAGRWLSLAGLCLASAAGAAVLPDDRSDLMYHYYDGGGVTVQGPALLVRKSVGDSVSLSGRYYVDTVSSASIDVITTASPYKDEREEYGVSIDYLRGNSLMSLSYSNGKENDYLADTYALNVSHEFFGGLTTTNIGYSQGHDTVLARGQRLRRRYQSLSIPSRGLSQIVTRRFLVGLGYEAYRRRRVSQQPVSFRSILGASQYEIYPRTRDSQAIALRAIMGFGSELGHWCDRCAPSIGISTTPGASVPAPTRWPCNNISACAGLVSCITAITSKSPPAFYSDNFSAPHDLHGARQGAQHLPSHSIGLQRLPGPL